MHNVCRFEKGRIYTYIGEVVVSVNPYRSVDLYGKNYVEQYRGREIYERPPHIFALADSAYKTMKRQAKDTCIVISGQSGSVVLLLFYWVCCLSAKISKSHQQHHYIYSHIGSVIVNVLCNCQQKLYACKKSHTHIKDPVTCSLCQSLKGYGYTKLTLHTLKRCQSSKLDTIQK